MSTYQSKNDFFSITEEQGFCLEEEVRITYKKKAYVGKIVRRFQNSAVVSIDDLRDKNNQNERTVIRYRELIKK